MNLSPAVLVVALSLRLMAEALDIGRHGEVYTITEKPLLEMIKEGAADINYTKVEQEFMAGVEAVYHFEHQRPACREESETSVANTVVAPYDVHDRMGRTVFHAGQKIPYSLPRGASFALCFIDGRTDVPSQLRAIDQSGIRCELAAANEDARLLSQRFSREINPLNRIILSRVEIPCYPSAVEFVGSEIKYRSFIPVKEPK